MKKIRWNFCITGAILIMLGILTLRYPVGAIMSVGLFIGIGLIASGLNYFSGYYFFGLKRFILLGILDLIMGIYMTAQPGITAFVIPFVIALYFFMTGISRICMSLWLGGAKMRGWWLMLLNGIALIAFSALMCVSPLTSTLSVMVILSAVLIASGVLSVLEGCIMFSE